MVRPGQWPGAYFCFIATIILTFWRSRKCFFCVIDDRNAKKTDQTLFSCQKALCVAFWKESSHAQRHLKLVSAEPQMSEPCGRRECQNEVCEWQRWREKLVMKKQPAKFSFHSGEQQFFCDFDVPSPSYWWKVLNNWKEKRPHTDLCANSSKVRRFCCAKIIICSVCASFFQRQHPQETGATSGVHTADPGDSDKRFQSAPARRYTGRAANPGPERQRRLLPPWQPATQSRRYVTSRGSKPYVVHNSFLLNRLFLSAISYEPLAKLGETCRSAHQETPLGLFSIPCSTHSTTTISEEANRLVWILDKLFSLHWFSTEKIQTITNNLLRPWPGIPVSLTIRIPITELEGTCNAEKRTNTCKHM